ncbi:hypothetical protein HFN88_12895 [Rhizobium laguerreae]|uniref:hypothetical protein n=1 Tax=Rhizobium laguerreae TaxID=1076926 RepID=UPI001C91FEAC|nr:hypothetical protein [Rhizobium laguerreae]MBY3393567.1 hypothetical protein [Rhizobium laguerreae]
MALKKSFARWSNFDGKEREAEVSATIGRPASFSRRPYHVELYGNIGSDRMARRVSTFIHPTYFDSVARLMFEAHPKKALSAFLKIISDANV